MKLICGASNQDLSSIWDLCALYATAGVHCIDVAADAAVVHTAREALDWVQKSIGVRPWLMISVSDGQDEHFRKAWFNPKLCPMDCPRPCQKTCPALAITKQEGINSKRCYGCGRCIPRCPLGLIVEQDHHLKLKDVGPLLAELRPDAIEIHTAPGRKNEFQATFSEIMSAKVPFQRVAVSCGLQGYGITAKELAQELWERHSYLRRYKQKPLWQLDGRRMSGDLGGGTAKVAAKLWQKIHPLAPPGPLQLAGGTNEKTINYLPTKNGPAGIAFGGMARKLIQPWLIQAEANQIPLRKWPEGWQAALQEAKQLINPWLLRSSGHHTC
ncbi:LdpA C-terminal domain-containing domain [Prochlorococcus sp. MIT 1307]|uniref:Light dependent period protein LdpA domain-containing protein n=1 Tax=Prochlorococcus sp. MIT 1307 TaxID=3096219 RepID=UPI002A74EA37|nr:LdpA C-terminal domain-containing domain [Prochlorococcus sp. MIT 1307]